VPSLRPGDVVAQHLLIVHSSIFLLKQLPNHDQDQAHRHADDHGDETSIGQEEKVLFLDMISVAAVLEIVAIDGSRSAVRDVCRPLCSYHPANARDHGDQAQVEGSQRQVMCFHPCSAKIGEIGSETMESPSPPYPHTSPIDRFRTVGRRAGDARPAGLGSLAVTVFELGGRGAFHAVEFGPRDAPPLIWLHGFPDHPLTAVPFLQLLAKSRRVIAPWLRGYAPSPLLGPFDMENLVADILALIDSLEAQQVDLVGHDWGAAITYATCAAAPQRVRRAVTLALPHLLTFLHMLKTGAQMRRSWYMALFQIPGSERLVLAKEMALLDHLWRTWSPKFELDEARRRTLHACLVASLPAPLGYYRAMVRPLARAHTRLEKLDGVLSTPLLQLHGVDDGCIVAPTGDDGRRFEHRELQVIDGVGHFLHLEAPSAIALRILGWLME
jgi:pimeloyl-ACP methyl ester carboxylesterase